MRGKRRTTPSRFIGRMTDRTIRAVNPRLDGLPPRGLIHRRGGWWCVARNQSPPVGQPSGHMSKAALAHAAAGAPCTVPHATNG